MFGFLKNKLKGVLSKFSKKVEESVEPSKEEAEERKEVELSRAEEEKSRAEEEKEIKARTAAEKIEGFEEEIKKGKAKKEAKEEKETAEEKRIVFDEEREEKPKEKKGEPEDLEQENSEQKKKGFFTKLKETFTTRKISEEQFDELFWELELALLENNAAVEVVEKIKKDLKGELVEKPLPRAKVRDKIADALKYSILELFEAPNKDFLEMVKSKKPFVVCFIGVNGSGKTTTIAKVARLLQNEGLSVVIAAADTFRAAAIDQLQMHSDKLGIKLIRHAYGADAAAVAFDAVKHAESKGKDVVLIDTAGRLHSNINLMDEMKKIVRVAKPDFKIFVGESITGNDCVEQAKRFNEAVDIDAIILAKADVDEKGGAALSVSYVTKKPLLFLGTGQDYEDLVGFDKEKLVASLGL